MQSLFSRGNMVFEDQIHRLIEKAIIEDLGSGDVTSEVCIPEDATISGRFILKQAGVVAGLNFLDFLFKKINPEIKVTLLAEEGGAYTNGTELAKIVGPARGILSAERVALNFLQHASGVATRTAAYVRKLVGIDCVVLDTRKTLPGLRALEKYAIYVAGGTNHRFRLDDRFVIKSNHLRFFTGPHPIRDAVNKVKAARPDLPVEVEIFHLDQLEEALSTDAEVIMLCRMTPGAIQRCVPKIHAKGKKVYFESLGTVTLDTIHAYAETGIDGIALGSLTLGAKGLEIGMRITS